MDIALKPEAYDILSKYMGSKLEYLPQGFLDKEPPSLSAILTIKTIASMLNIDDSIIRKIDSELAEITVTVLDQKARCARYDNVTPELDLDSDEINILVFNKINGFDHGASVDAATTAIKALAERFGWTVVVTDSAGVFNADTLALFDTVVWNNNSGDVLTLSQRSAFMAYINKGGSYLGLHGAGGDSIYLWQWYVDELLGARFIGHTVDPQFQEASVIVQESPSGIGVHQMPGWKMTDEWYSFAESPRLNGAGVVAMLDETSYTPEARGQDLRMGGDHPIAWYRCVGKGRAFYSAIGHRPESYHIPENLMLLKDALEWSVNKDKVVCSQE